MTTKSFLTTAASSANFTTATLSAPVSTPNPYKAVVAKINGGSGSATVVVLGSINGGTHNVTLGTISLSGSGAVGGFTSTDAYDTYLVDTSTISAATVNVSVRYAHN